MYCKLYWAIVIHALQLPCTAVAQFYKNMALAEGCQKELNGTLRLQAEVLPPFAMKCARMAHGKPCSNPGMKMELFKILAHFFSLQLHITSWDEDMAGEVCLKRSVVHVVHN